MFKKWIKQTLVCTGDTDVLVLLISALTYILEQYPAEVICRFGIGENIRHYNVNEICLLLT